MEQECKQHISRIFRHRAEKSRDLRPFPGTRAGMSDRSSLSLAASGDLIFGPHTIRGHTTCPWAHRKTQPSILPLYPGMKLSFLNTKSRYDTRRESSATTSQHATHSPQLLSSLPLTYLSSSGKGTPTSYKKSPSKQTQTRVSRRASILHLIRRRQHSRQPH